MDDLIYQVKIPDLSLCDRIIELDAGKSYEVRRETPEGSLQKHSTDTVFDFLLCKDYFPCIKELSDVLSTHTEIYWRKYKVADHVGPWSPVLFQYHWNRQHYKPGDGYYRWHSEWSTLYNNRAFVWMLYLNDVENAGTDFKYYKKRIEAEKGILTIWPAGISHTHRGVISQTQDKWIATGWILGTAK